MLTLKQITTKPEEIIQLLAIKNFQAKEIIEQIIEVDQKKRKAQKVLDDNRAEQKTLAKKIGILFKEKKIEEAHTAKTRATELKEIIKDMEDSFHMYDKGIQKLLIKLPNIPHESVPPGKSENDNQEIKSYGKIPNFNFTPLPHWELAEKYDIIDFELGNKITGAGFPVYKKQGAKLQRALINFFLHENEKAGYTEIMPPLMVNEATAYATGQLPDKEGQMYELKEEKFYMIPTAEVPLTNIYRDVILNENNFPIKLTGYTPCFRREAGSYGKDVRGLNRIHQFDKVEIVQIQKPEKSYETLDKMVSHVESLIKKLELPYRILRLCGGDLSFTAALTFDFEVFSTAQAKWLEVSSVSNFETFQSNRLKLRYKTKEYNKKQLPHTLNGSALALPRIVAALLENNQTEKYIKIPKALRKFTGFDKITF